MEKIKEKKYRALSIISKYSFVLIIVFSFLLPVVFVGAEKESVTIDAKIENPLGENMNTLPDFIRELIRIVLIVGVPILVLAIIYAGFLYVKAQGNPGELEVAHRTLLYTVIGGALLLGAFVIAEAIRATVADIGGGV